MKVVLDTNILISGTFWKGISSQIIDLIDKGDVELILSRELVEEYDEVLNREEIVEKVENKNLIFNKSIQKIISEALIVSPTIRLDILKEDEDDNRVLECAFEGKVDFIVSYDKSLLKLGEFEGIKIVTPDEFLKIIEKDT